MRVKTERVCLGLLALVFAGIAAVGLLAPHALFEPTGLHLDTIAGVAEIRAAYGGLFGGAAYVFVIGARDAVHRRLALTMAVLVLGGFTLGRLFSWGADGTPDVPVAMVNLVRLTGGHSATALELANRKFTSRFERLEAVAAERNVVLGEATLEELDAIWNEIKAAPEA